MVAMRSINVSIQFAVVLTAALIFCNRAVAIGFPFRTVAVSGSQVPNATADVTFESFSFPLVNNQGKTTFFGQLSGASVNSSNDRGLYTGYKPNSVSYVARHGDNVPGLTPSGTFFLIEFPVMNNVGSIGFKGLAFQSGIGIKSTYYTNRGGALAAVLKNGDPAPGFGGDATLDTIGTDAIEMNDSDQIAFTGRAQSSSFENGVSVGLWTDRASNGLDLLVNTGGGLPGLPTPITITGGITPQLAENGKIAFRARFDDGNSSFPFRYGVWFDDPTEGLSVVAYEGGPSPSGGPFLKVYEPGMNSQGDIAFSGLIDQSSSLNDNGIWTTARGAPLSLVARENDIAPGVGPIARFAGIGRPIVSDNGDIAFAGTVRGTGINSSNDFGVFVDREDSGLEAIMREGQSANGFGPGVSVALFDNYTMNRNGLVVVSAFVSGAGIDSTNDRALWVSDMDGNLELIFREGGLFDVNDDPFLTEFRTILSFDYIGEYSADTLGNQTSLNDFGRLAVSAIFTDGSSGVFVLAVPEPTLGLFGFVVMCGLVCRHRRN